MNWLNIILIVYYVLVVIAIVHVVMDNRQPAKTMAWALVIYFVPVVGIVFYLFFGINHRKERYVSERSMNQLTKRSMLEFAEQQNLRLPDKHKPLIDLFVNQNLALPFKDNLVDICTDGYQFIAELMDGSNYVILGSTDNIGTVTVQITSTIGDNYTTFFDTSDGTIFLPISGNTGYYTLTIITSDGTHYVGEFTI